MTAAHDREATKLCMESVSLSNFQSHVETRLQFAGEGRLTVIVGPTDSGKTTIVRALKWVSITSPQAPVYSLVLPHQCP